MSYNLAIKATTDNAAAQAYRDYCDNVKATVAQLMAMCQSAIQEELPLTNERVQSIISDIAEGFDADSVITCSSGAIKLGSLLRCLQDATSVDGGEDEKLSNLVDAADFAGFDHTTVSDVLSDLQATYHAVTVEAGVGAALSDSSRSISDKLSMLRDSIAETFQSSYVDLSSRLTRAAAQLRNGVGIRGYLATMLVESGIEEQATSGSWPSRSLSSSYAGASPAAAFTLHASKNQVTGVLAQAGRVLAQAVKVTLGAIASVGKSLVSSAVSKLQELTNPVDLEIINPNGWSTIDSTHLDMVFNLGSRGSRSAFVRKLAAGPIYMDLLPCEVIIQMHKGTLTLPPADPSTESIMSVLYRAAEYNDVSLTGVSSIADALEHCYPGFRESGMSMHAYANSISGYPTTVLPIRDALQYAAGYDLENVPIHVLIRPKVINPNLLNNAQAFAVIDDQVHVTAKAFIDAMRAYYDSGQLYDVKASDEGALYAGLLAGRLASHLTLTAISSEVTGGLAYDPGSHIIAYLRTDNGMTTGVCPTDFVSLTNQDFFVTATKAQPSRMVPGYTDLHLALGRWSVGMIFDLFETLFQQMENDPLNAPFWPYIHHYCKWHDASYRIRTDIDNINRFNNFVAGAVIIAAVAVASFATVALLGKMSTRLKIKEQAAYMKAVSAAQNGQLSAEHIRGYRKATRKVNMLNALTGNLTSGNSSGTQFDSGASTINQLSQIAVLITGEPL